MATFKNTSPLGALEVPALGITVDAGAEFDVDEGDAFAVAAGGFEPVDQAAIAAAAELAALDAALAEQELPPRRHRPAGPAPEADQPQGFEDGEDE